jgi:hypothetical protein
LGFAHTERAAVEARNALLREWQEKGPVSVSFASSHDLLQYDCI